MKLSDFDYDLPKELIAQEPPAGRGSSRLLVLDRKNIAHRKFSDFFGYLQKGDVLVLNDSKVIPARICAKRASGAKLEFLVLKTKGSEAEALVRGKPLRAGEKVVSPTGDFKIVGRIAGSRYLLEFPSDAGAYLESFGQMPTPPYIKKKLLQQDRYQTVFAATPGSVAAPTAGLHFTHETLAGLRKKGVTVAFITLHIGPATFSPVKVDDLGQHRMEAEYYSVPPGTADAINQRKGMLFVTGTTVVKALESAARHDRQPGTHSPGTGLLNTSEGWSDLFIYPGHNFAVRPDAMLTNFHLPKSTLLMLVSALTGRDRLLAAYREAVDERYRFYSFGDAMLCLNLRQ